MTISPIDAARTVLGLLKESGHDAYLAGGSVRDHLLGLEPTDYDVATSALPEQVEGLFKRTIAVGKAFGVIRVLIGERSVEVATFRSEADYRDGRRPDTVTFTDARTDVQRRDFTVNGLLLDPDSGEILDYVGGRKDLERRVIRAIGDPDERLEEDGLRLLRAVRFGAFLDFRLEDETRAAVLRQAQRIRNIAPERIREELHKMATSSRTRRGDAWRLLRETGLAGRLFFVRLPDDGAEEDARVLDALEGRTLPGFLAVILRGALDPGTPPKAWRALAESVADGLRCSSEEKRLLARLLEFRGRYRSLPTASLVRRRLASTLKDQVDHEDLLLAEGDAAETLDTLQQTRRSFGAELPAPLITGTDLKRVAVPAGPRMGWLLRKARVLQLAGAVLDEEAALVSLGVGPGGAHLD